MPLSSRDLFIAVVLVGVLLLLVAGLVNWLAPAQRPRLRTPLILFAFYVLLAAGLEGARVSHADKAIPWMDFSARLLGGFTAVTLLSLLFVDVLLPRVGLRFPHIAGDLLSAVGYGAVAVVVATDTGVSATSALAGGTVVAAALTISLQSTLGNVIGGVALQLDGTVQVGDWVQLEGGRQGRVAAIRWRHTLVETRDGDAIVLPNSILLATPITLLGRRDGVSHPHRQWVHFRVDHRFNPAKVVAVVQEALRASALAGVAAAPLPDVVCVELGKDPADSMALYAVRYWLSDLSRDVPVDSAVRARVQAALQRAGISLALPAYTVFNAAHDDLEGQARQGRRLERAYRVLRSVELFRSLSDEECMRLATGLRYVPFAAGEVITRQGAVAHHLYLLAAGEVEVRLDAQGHTQTVASLQAPDFFGEMGLLTGAPRSASIVAAQAVTCYQLDHDAFEGVLKARPDVAEELAGVTAARQTALSAVREGLDARQAGDARRRETARILASMKEFFGLAE